MSKRATDFMKDWISANVHNVPGLTDPGPEVDRLAGELWADAASAGIPRSEIEAVVGDTTEALTEAYETVHDPELGFKD
jgi:hypothetical protein